MKALELKVPPPLVAVLIAAGMWLLARNTTAAEIPAAWRLALAAVFALAGISLAVAAFIAFHRAQTTANPIHPEKATSLVTSGIFSRTRNPMYLSLLIMLTAWTIYLSSPWAVVGLPAFALFIARFQIAPEEQILSAKFGSEFTAYREKVRRWL